MSLITAAVQGTLKEDGTLDLDETPTLAPGRVLVVIVPMPIATFDQARPQILDVLDRIRVAQEARGYRGRSSEEMEADEADRQAEAEEYEQRCRAGWRQSPSPF
jgi:hypothetical protein